MNAGKMALSVLAGIFALAAARGDGALTDDEVKARIVKFARMPSLLCGHAAVDFRNELRTRKLTNSPWFDGDTNRLARLICELAQTNNAEVAEMMIDELGEYGTPAQLPFLYSCATNPAVGTRAVNAILNIEGVTSNSVAVVCGYVGMTNVNKSIHWDHVDVFKRMIGMLGDGNPELKNQLVRGCIQPHALLNNHCPRQLDSVIMSADGSYRFSQRRLSTLRSVLACGLNEFQAPYVTNAINELVAYPEANLPE